MEISLKSILGFMVIASLMSSAGFAAKIFEEEVLDFDFYAPHPGDPVRLHGVADNNCVYLPACWGAYPSTWRDLGYIGLHNSGWGMVDPNHPDDPNYNIISEMSVYIALSDLNLPDDYSFEIDHQSSIIPWCGNGPYWGILFNTQNTDAYWGNGYMLSLYSWPDRVGIPPNWGPYYHRLVLKKVYNVDVNKPWEFFKDNNSVLAEIADANAYGEPYLGYEEYEEKVWHTWKIEVEHHDANNYITVYRDGNVITWDDGNTVVNDRGQLQLGAPVFTGGTVGAWVSFEREAAIDNIRVYDSNGPDPVYANGDINKDGVVDYKDLKEITDDWLAGAQRQKVFEEYITDANLDCNWITLPSDGGSHPGPMPYGFSFSNAGSGNQAAYAADLTLPSRYSYEYNLITYTVNPDIGRQFGSQFSCQNTAYYDADGYFLQVYGPDDPHVNEPGFYQVMTLIRTDYRSDFPYFKLGRLSDANAIAYDLHDYKIDVVDVAGTDYITCYVDGEPITWDEGIFAGYSTARDPLRWPDPGTVGYWNAHERMFVVNDIIVTEMQDTYFDSGYKASDINKDWRVDFHDFALLAVDWMEP
ncbi:MAG: hypothetical protein ABIG61_11255 [Planctomycetota bacterium]